jgi:hypothetical protein
MSGAKRAGHWWHPKRLHPGVRLIIIVVGGAVLSILAGFFVGKNQGQPAFEPPFAVSSSRLDASEDPRDPALAPLPPLRGREPAKATPKGSGTPSSGYSPSERESLGGANSGSGGVGPSSGGDKKPAKAPAQSPPTETVPERKPTETVTQSTTGKVGK